MEVIFWLIIIAVIILRNKKKSPTQVDPWSEIFSQLQKAMATNSQTVKTVSIPVKVPVLGNTTSLEEIEQTVVGHKRQAGLNRKTKYLQIALNSNLMQARQVISQLPRSNRIIIEAGTPLIKQYGSRAISEIRAALSLEGFLPQGDSLSYIVADLKVADLADREVTLAAEAGASAATCLGVAPVETIDNFIATCEQYGIDSMIDMMNVDNPIMVLRKLKEPPDVVIVHRGVDETEINKEKLLPYYQINQIKGSYNIMVAVAGGDSIQEIRSAVFNGADIIVLWKAFYQGGGDTSSLVNEFLKEIR